MVFRTLVWVLFFCLLAIGVVGEVVVRFSEPLLVAQSPIYYNRQYVRQLVQADRNLIWRGKAGADQSIVNSEGQLISYRLNKEGWRDSDNLSRGILLLGDSFTFGTGVEESKRYGAVLSRSLGVPVLHAGVMGWSVDQHLLTLRDLLRSNSWSAIVLQLSNNDLSDVAGHRWENNEGQQVDSPVRIIPKETPSILVGHSEFVSLLSHLRSLWSGGRSDPSMASQALPRFEFVLEEIFRTAEKSGIPIVVLQATDWGANAYGPSTAEAYERVVRSLCQRFRAPLLTPHSHFTLKDLLPFPDLHWRAETHARVAAELQQVLRRQK